MSEELSYIKDAFTKTGENVNLEVDNLNATCITSSNNKFQLDSEGNLTVKSITLTEGTIDNQSIMNFIYPVGSIYMSVNNADPNVIFGGVWERFANGRCLVGVDTTQTEFDTSQKAGGSKDFQEHYHDIRWNKSDGDGVTISVTGTGQKALDISSWSWNYNRKNVRGSGSNLYTSKEGTGTSGNLQPYITCYIWKRTA